jgi:hypothetical protein
VVVIVRIELAEFPFTVMTGGLKLQAANWGRLEQARESWPVNPPCAVAEIE